MECNFTCEEVTTVMPISAASLYRCSSTSTLVALQKERVSTISYTQLLSEKEKRIRGVIDILGALVENGELRLVEEKTCL